ncbi:MAG: hypothetical protein EAZ07_06910 [Cytophagales bacterium]|nr:MAG: hypothetical protein EAZ07_06910 [Cytophagales bacterium]
MKIIYALFLLVYSSFIIVQYNDPDPFIWITIYGYGLLMILLGFINRYNQYFTLSGIIAYTIGALYLLPSVIEWIEKEKGHNLMQRMVDNKMYIEETREFGGLIIASLLLVVQYFLERKRKMA